MVQKFIRSFDGTNVHYFFKKNKKMCIVFLHGLSGGYKAWQFCYPFFFKKGHSILSLDLRGHGYSDKPLDRRKYSIESAAKDLDLIIRKEKIKKVILVGHCFGVYVAMLYYFMRKSKVEKIIFISPHISPKSELRLQIFGKAYMLLISSTKLFYSKKLFIQQDWDSFRGIKDIDVVRILQLIKVASPETMNYYLKHYYAFDGKKLAKKIKLPLLIIHGKKDMIVLEKFPRELHEIIADSKLVILKDTNHNPPLNAPGKINRLVLDFIKN